MKGKLQRTFLMISGIATVVIILLSQSYYQFSPGNSSALKKEHVKKEHAKESKTDRAKHTVSIAPDVMPSPAVQLDKSTPSLLKIFAPLERTEQTFFPDSRIFVSFFKALLRATISPNAP